MWLGNLGGCPRTWSKSDVDKISSLLKKCNETLPNDIHRSIRSLDQISNWKGTEFRTFLLYLGIVVLKDFLNQDEYELFLKLHCAITICTVNIYRAFLPVARKLFNDFIEKHITLYGEGSITINIHNLSHVVDEVENFGPLHTISAYEFENALHHIKLRLKQCNRPLQQIARRIGEMTIPKENALLKQNEFPKLKDQCYDNVDLVHFYSIEYKPNVMLSSKDNMKNKYFLSCANEIVEFHYVVRDVNEKKNLIWGSPLKNIDNFHQQPFDSKYLNTFVSDGEKSVPQYYELNSIKAKMFSLSYQNKFVFIPLLHTM